MPILEIKKIPPEVMQFVKVTAIGGFVATSALIVNINFRAFSKVFSARTRSLWWLFLLLMIFPLLIFLYLFSLLFGK